MSFAPELTSGRAVLVAAGFGVNLEPQERSKNDRANCSTSTSSASGTNRRLEVGQSMSALPK